MSYEMTVKFRQARYSFPSGLTTYQAVGGHLLTNLGRFANLVRLAEQLDEAVVAYDTTGQNQLEAHQSVVDQVGNLVGQFAIQAIQIEVEQVTRYGFQAGGAAALSALGITSKQKPEVVLAASAAFFLGGYLLGELKPLRRTTLRAHLDPYRGWVWVDVAPPQLGWSQASS